MLTAVQILEDRLKAYREDLKKISQEIADVEAALDRLKNPGNSLPFEVPSPPGCFDVKEPAEEVMMPLPEIKLVEPDLVKKPRQTVTTKPMQVQPTTAFAAAAAPAPKSSLGKCENCDFPFTEDTFFAIDNYKGQNRKHCYSCHNALMTWDYPAFQKRALEKQK